MSGATYRIDVRHKPEDEGLPWRADVYRVSDETLVTIEASTSRPGAIENARRVVNALNAQQEPFSLYVDDEGQDAEAPHSVKA